VKHSNIAVSNHVNPQSTVTFGEITSFGIPTLPVIKNARRIALIGGFTPRQCGIATFTADVYASLMIADPNLEIQVYAMGSKSESIEFPEPVACAIHFNERQSFIETARAIEQSRPDVIWLQHEFGLFGGSAGELILELTDIVSAPLITTLHTVIAQPDAEQARVMQRIIARSSGLVVMSEKASSILSDIYGVSRDLISVIPHGVPDRPFGRTEQFKTTLQLDGYNVLMTFGLLSPGKGIEAVIAAMPAIIQQHPRSVYCIVGATHPNLLATEGEAYRQSLKNLAEELGVEKNILWEDAFLENETLLDMIEAADIYITPYTGAAQSTSGTLSYAVALGKAVISTPYSHAVELLADDRGVLVPFDNSTAIASAACELLSNPDQLKALQRRAYNRGRTMLWSESAKRSLDVIDSLINVSAQSERPLFNFDRPEWIGVDGLVRICDDTGILQHSIVSVPDRSHGYCLDDNARALMLMNRIDDRPGLSRDYRSTVFAGFVQNAWNPDNQQFRNFMGYARNWLEDLGSEDSCGRALWALGATSAEGNNVAIKQWAIKLYDQACPSASRFESPRAIAFALLGADYMLQNSPHHAEALNIIITGADKIYALLHASRRPDWHWFEVVLAYDNCRIPEAMIRAGLRFDNAKLLQCGLETLHWITEHQIAPAGHFRPVGSSSFGAELVPPQPFDQQPVEAWAAIDAASAAYDATGDMFWVEQADRAYRWFSGENDRGAVVAIRKSGTCRDGINPRGLNLNEGAESVLAFQLATCSMEVLMKNVKLNRANSNVSNFVRNV
jgi:glycosyltransferase involved in cell wall biosynthesis